MSGGVGFAKLAQATTRDNRVLLKRTLPFQKIKDNNFINAPRMNFKEASPEVLAELRENLLKENKSNQLKRNLLLGTIFLVTALLSMWILFA